MGLTLIPHWGILFVWIVNIDFEIQLGTPVLLNLCMCWSPCVFGDSHQCSSKHILSFVTQMCFNNTTLFWSKAEILIINTCTEKPNKFHKMGKTNSEYEHTPKSVFCLHFRFVFWNLFRISICLCRQRLSFHLLLFFLNSPSYLFSCPSPHLFAVFTSTNTDVNNEITSPTFGG